MTAFRIGPRCNDDDVGKDAIGDIGLRTVQNPVVAHIHGAAFHTSQIAAGAWLRHRYGQYFFAADNARHEPRLLFIGA